ncbi:MAG: transposase [Actinomycetia bacterium]|nr:transposase [Actinomycetes bacterium]
MTRDDDVEVPRQKRSWPAQYKLDILAEIDGAKASGEPGVVGEICRRENLYSSLISEWRSQRDAGALEALKGSKSGRPAKDRTRAELAQTRERVEQLEAELATAKELIEAQGKVSALLAELSRESADPRPTKRPPR